MSFIAEIEDNIVCIELKYSLFC